MADDPKGQADENLTDEDRSKGGRAAHQKGTAHKFTTEEAGDAGEKSGKQKSSQD